MPSPGFDGDGGTDAPHPPLPNSTRLYLVAGPGGAPLVILLVATGLAALFRTRRAADSAAGEVGAATPVSLRDATVTGEPSVS